MANAKRSNTDSDIDSPDRRVQSRAGGYLLIVTIVVVKAYYDLQIRCGSGQRGALVHCLVEHVRQRAFEVWRNHHLEQLPQPHVLCGDSGPDS